MRIDDPYDLERFVVAQGAGGSYAAAAAELRAGRKTGHWMWFVFPQVAGLGASSMSKRYAISSLEEARAYLAHPILGKRLVECASVLSELEGRTAQDVFGTVDAMKLRSSMTLFARAAPDEPLFLEVLGRYFAGLADEATDARVEAQARGYSPAPSMAARRSNVTERERDDEQGGSQYGGDRGGASAGEAGGQGGDSGAAGDAAREQRTQSVAEQEGKYAGTESGGEEGGGADE